MAEDVIWFGILGLWAILVVFAIKPFYHYLRKQGSEHMVAVYYNRKVSSYACWRSANYRITNCF